MITIRSKIFWIAAVLAIGGVGPVQGSQPAQEIGDVDFRTLNLNSIVAAIIGTNDHNGIFLNFTGQDTSDLTNYNFTEMLGENTQPCGVGPGIVTDTLYCFNVPNTSYLGSYTIPYHTLLRPDRVAILNTEAQLETLSQQGAITYVTGSTLGVPAAVYTYIVFNSNAEIAPGTLDPGAITQMRSDAVTEFSYASNGFPIVCAGGSCVDGGPNLTLINDTTYFNALIYLPVPHTSITPATQLSFMFPSYVDFPSITVTDQNGNNIAAGGVSSSRNITITVGDLSSGPGLIQVFQGPAIDPTLLGSNEDLPYQNVSTRTFTAADNGLSVLGNLPNGQIIVTAYDQAGNQSSQSFQVPGPPSVSLDGPMENLYDGFSGVGTAADAPSTLQTPSPSAFNFSVSADAALQTVVVTGPSGAVPLTLTSSGPNAESGTFMTTGIGLYTLTATDIDNNQTVAPFQNAQLNATLDSTSQAQYNTSNGNWTWTAILDATSSIGLDHVSEFNPYYNSGGDDGPADGPIVQGYYSLGGQNSYQASFTGSAPVSQSTPSFNAEVVDTDGNWSKYTLTMSTGGNATSLGFMTFTSTATAGTFTNSSIQVLQPGTTGLAVQGTGSYTSPIFDLFQSSVMPGALLRGGVWTGLC